jgi:hypothetical protein
VLESFLAQLTHSRWLPWHPSLTSAFVI